MADAQEARKVAEESREKVWSGESFIRDVFLGNFRIDLLERLSLDEPDRPRSRNRAELGRAEGPLEWDSPEIERRLSELIDGAVQPAAGGDFTPPAP